MQYKIIEGIEQGTQEWHDLRCGSVGGTGLKEIITSSGNPRPSSRNHYLYHIAGEIIEGKSLEQWRGNAWTKRGHGLEAEAKAELAYKENLLLKDVTMIKHTSLYWHVSPDAILEDETGGVEVKCLGLEEYHNCKKRGVLPTKHILQVQGSLALTGWEYWWFFIYFPSLEPLCIKVERDEDLISIIRAEIRMFCREVDEILTTVKKGEELK